MMRQTIKLFLILCFTSINSIAQKQGQDKIDSLLAVLKIAKEDTSKVNLQNIISRQFLLISEIEKSFYYCSLAKHLADSLNFKKGIANAYHNLGNVFYFQSNYDEALNNNFAALKIREEINDKKGMAISYGNIGNIYHEQGNYTEAFKNYYANLKIAKDIGDKEGVASSYNNIGVACMHQGNYPEALKNYFASLKISEEIGNKNSISSSFGNIGDIYMILKNYPEALKKHFASLKIEEELESKIGIAQSYSSIGYIYYNQFNYPEALRYYSDALKIYKEIENKKGEADTYNNIASINVSEGNYLEGLKNSMSSLKLQKEIGNKSGIAPCYISLGTINTKLKKYIIAKKYFTDGISISKEIKSITDLKDIYNGLTILDSTRGNWKDAYANYRMFVYYRDSLINEEAKERVVRLQMQFDFDNKEAATKAAQDKKDAVAKTELEKQKLLRNSIAGGGVIILLASIFSFFFYKRKRDAEQNQKETALSLQVSETEMKALRSQMNPHFIFNALQSIQTFLLSHKSEEANLYLLKFSKLMRAVLENSQHSEVSLAEDMKALELYMQLESIRLPYPFTYEFQVDKTIDTEETTIPPLILQPFVENAIWHGLQYKQGPGHININISKKENALYATVEDNGVGRDMSKRVAQPMLVKRESLGMKLTEERLKILNELKKIKAQFKITDLFTKDNQPAGTKVELSLPLVA